MLDLWSLFHAKFLSAMTEETSSDNAGRADGNVMKPGRYRSLRQTTLVFVCAVLIAAAPTETSADIAASLDHIYSGDNYQRELPSEPGAGPLRAMRDQSDGQPRDEITIPDVPEDIEDAQRGTFSANPAVELLLWMLLGVGVLLLGVHLFNAVSRMRWPFSGAGTDVPSQSAALPDHDESPVARPLSEIERLAAEGAFGEAVHMLLLHSFQQLRRRFPYAQDPALTSREVLARTSLTPKAQSGLAVIVATVEAGHFGGKAIGQATFERCLEGYRHLTVSDAS